MGTNDVLKRNCVNCMNMVVKLSDIVIHKTLTNGKPTIETRFDFGNAKAYCNKGHQIKAYSKRARYFKIGVYRNKDEYGYKQWELAQSCPNYNESNDE